MVSFDVVNLFTNVPVDEALWVISNQLQQDETYGEQTNIPIPELCYLLELCLRPTYFQFDGSFFGQVQGAAMGSPLSPIVANIFMEDLEMHALKMSPCKPKMWLRYIRR